MPKVAVIIVAAGSGTRLGLGVPKAFVTLGGRTLLERAVDAVAGMSEAAQLVVVAPATHLDAAAAAVGDRGTVVAGGDTRQRSVAAGLARVGEVDVVLVHDAARALTPSRVFDAVVARVRETGRGVVPGLPVVNTLKRVDEAGGVIDNVDRASLRAVQTPQGFPRAALVAAYESAGADHTDDAALFSEAGHPVDVIEGDPMGFKITNPGDLNRAEQAAGISAMRTGIGIDVHAFDDAAPLWLGGLHWPDEPGLAGHSDGDAVSHAICDALLSAGGLGDMGSVFGASDPRFEGAHGDVFVSHVRELLAGAGFAIVNVAVQLVGNRPRVGARRTELEAHLSRMVGAPVSVSATTTDGLGFTGRGEGVTAVATALVQRLP